MTSGDGEGNVPRETLAGNSLAEAAERIIERWVETQCSRCEAGYSRRVDAADSGMCAACERAVAGQEKLDREIADVRARWDAYVRRWLREAGMSARELTAVAERIPAPLRATLFNGDRVPAAIVREMELGQCPKTGFGLTGSVGLGKTFALAVIVRRMLEARWETWLPRDGMNALRRRWLVWCSWPEVVNKLRIMSIADDGLAEAAKVIEALAAAEVLVIDDLGVERFRGSYEDDWAASQFDVLVDARYNEMRPTWYTTNLERDEFQDRYGARVWSRLCGENPMISAPKGPDLRVMERKP
jgi:DNA replication protein DnaC